MKKILFLFAMAISIIAFATQPEPPVYYTGNNEIAASTGVVTPDSVPLSKQSAVAVGSVGARHDLPRCPVYLTGNNEPAAFGLFIAESSEL